VVRTDLTCNGSVVGLSSPGDDPEVFGDLIGPLDGGLDSVSGHGTFVAGLVHQGCPDADIVAIRVVHSDGVVVESELVDALSELAELVRRSVDGEADGQLVDVVNLSMGYYHETPEDALFDSVMLPRLHELGALGVAVVVSAGNDATARPLFPAAFAPFAGGPPPIPDCVPVTTVGALNPDGSVSLFNNAGPWVGAWRPGAALVSTMPAYGGGNEPLARTRVAGQERESIDPDDFSGGFAVWSGTSFASPVLAGQVAASLMRTGLPEDGSTRGDRVGRMRKVLAKVLEVPS
jgi:subtilisin family serine protease